MKALRFALLADGESDRALSPILEWALRQRLPHHALVPEWVERSLLRARSAAVADRLTAYLECGAYLHVDLLFVHRDAERGDVEVRMEEIRSGATLAGLPPPPLVCVVPKQMTEAWLLFDEAAIRRAADNPNGRVRLNVPRQWEELADPKAVLNEALRLASGLSGRRADQFGTPRELARRRIRTAELIDDFTPLRTLSAFSRLEEEIDRICRAFED